LLAVGLLPAAGQAGPIVGQIDTFEDNTTQGWSIGTPPMPGPGFTPPVIVPTGGPTGAGDHFMLLTADGVRPGGRLTVFNRQQWAGDFLSAGVNAVDMDLKNLGTVPLTLSMRIAIKTNDTRTSTGYSSTTPFILPPDGQWHHAVFLLDPDNLTPIGSPPPLDTLLSNVAEFRILDSVRPALNGDVIDTKVGVDNIRALELPEPGSFALFLAGGAGAWGWLCRRRSR
jgi:hypothetical protein